jgi:hypothetical protein
MNRQISQCSFNVVTFDGTNTTAINGFPVTVNTYSGAYTYRPYFHTGSAFDEAITGTLRSQLGGYRFEASLSWERLLNSAPLLTMINQAYTNTNAEVIIRFHPDATNTSVFENVVIEDVVWDSQLQGTIVRQPISVRLKGKEVRPTIPTFYQI